MAVSEKWKQREIAAAFRISQPRVSAIKLGLAWASATVDIREGAAPKPLRPPNGKETRSVTTAHATTASTEVVVDFAYPTSSRAEHFKRPEGCYVVSDMRRPGKLAIDAPFASRKAAEIAAEERGHHFGPMYRHLYPAAAPEQP
jgi:hypothetical protein